MNSKERIRSIGFDFSFRFKEKLLEETKDYRIYETNAFNLSRMW